jgi:hypothetical protein
MNYYTVRHRAPSSSMDASRRQPLKTWNHPVSTTSSTPPTRDHSDPSITAKDHWATPSPPDDFCYHGAPFFGELPTHFFPQISSPPHPTALAPLADPLAVGDGWIGQSPLPRRHVVPLPYLGSGLRAQRGWVGVVWADWIEPSGTVAHINFKWIYLNLVQISSNVMKFIETSNTSIICSN